MATKTDNPGVNGYSYAIQKVALVDSNGDISSKVIAKTSGLDRGTGTANFTATAGIVCNKEGNYNVKFSADTTAVQIFLVGGMYYSDFSIINILTTSNAALSANDITLLY